MQEVMSVLLTFIQETQVEPELFRYLVSHEMINEQHIS